jgi:hypothetical protein
MSDTIESLSKKVLSAGYGMFSKKGNRAIGEAVLHYLKSEYDYDPESVARRVPDWIGNPNGYDSCSDDEEYSDSFDEATDTTVRECIYYAYEQYRPLFLRAMASNCSDDELLTAMNEKCMEMGWKHRCRTDLLLKEFNEWFPTAPTKYAEKYNRNIEERVPRRKPEVAKLWIEHIYTVFNEQRKLSLYDNAIKAYCTKNGYEYTPLMNKKFLEWMYSTTRTEKTPKQCVNVWFSTLKKTVEL